MNEYVEYHHDESGFEVNEPGGGYDANRDFTSLEAWKKAREVKLFFYRIPYTLYPCFRSNP